MPDDVLEIAQGGAVRVVHVVDGDDERSGGAQPLQRSLELAHRADLWPSVRCRGDLGERTGRRVPDELLDQTERQVPLGQGAERPQGPVIARVGPFGEGVDQLALAASGGALDEDDAGRAVPALVQCGAQCLHFRLLFGQSHSVPPNPALQIGMSPPGERSRWNACAVHGTPVRTSHAMSVAHARPNL